jgi:hypothetical protein
MCQKSLWIKGKKKEKSEMKDIFLFQPVLGFGNFYLEALAFSDVEHYIVLHAFRELFKPCYLGGP